jgi:hypothetical protein
VKLLTKELEKKLPKLGSQDGKDPKTVPIIVKFFHPCSSYTWYASEGEKLENGDWEFFGLVRGHENELGYFRLSELQEVKVRGLSIERDMYFGDHTLAEALKEQI